MKIFAVCASVLFAGICQWATAATPDQAGESEDAYMRLDVCLGCHDEQYEAIRSTAHWMAGDVRAPASVHQCSACHGDLEAHVNSEGEEGTGGLKPHDKTGMMTPAEQNSVCTGCHRESGLLHWQGGPHDTGDVGCVGCHRLHGEDRVRSRQTEAGVCYDCHAELRAQVYKPYGHPLRDGKMACSDCHNPHGGAGDADLKTFSVNETCYACHAEKRGPFLWEHAPASENCLLCHSAHGSIHKDMLTRSAPHLCQSCHEPTAIANNPLGPHAQHSRLALGFRTPGAPDQGPTVGGRGISRLVLGESCGNCHNKVHGSNHPAGAGLTR